VISDPTRNWTGCVEKTLGTTNLRQARTRNHVNEIHVDDNHASSAAAGITATTGTNRGRSRARRRRSASARCFLGQRVALDLAVQGGPLDAEDAGRPALVPAGVLERGENVHAFHVGQ